MNKFFPIAAASLLVACVAQPADDGAAAPESTEEAIVGDHMSIYVSEAKCKKPGAYVASFETATPAQVALDAYCGDRLAKRVAPQGWVAVFGSSRLGATTPEYANAQSFASLWTQQHTTHPIMSGGGPGLMEAANKGANEAGGPSIGLSTYFKGPTDALNTFVTDGYMFSDFETRERAMLRYASAAVIYWGGVGTAWELFMTISDVQTKRLKKIPIILVGKDWTDALKPYTDFMIAKGTVSAPDIAMLTIVETPAQTVAAINAQLALP